MYDEVIKAVVNNTIDSQFAMDGVASGASGPIAIAHASPQHQTSSPSDFNLAALLNTRMQFFTDGDGEIPCDELGNETHVGYFSRSKKHASFMRRRRTVSFNLNLISAEENQVPPCVDRTSLKRKPSGLSDRGRVAKQAATNPDPNAVSPHTQDMLLEDEEETELSDVDTETTAGNIDLLRHLLAASKALPRRAATPRLCTPTAASINSSSGSPRRSLVAKSLLSSSPRRARRPVAHKRIKRPLAEADNDEEGAQSDSSGIVNAVDFTSNDRAVNLRPTVTAAKKLKSKIHVTEDYLVQHLRDIAITNDYSNKSRLVQPSISDSLARMLNESLGMTPSNAVVTENSSFQPHAANNLHSVACGSSVGLVEADDLESDDAVVHSNSNLLAESETISLPVNGYDADDEEDTISIAGSSVLEQLQSNRRASTAFADVSPAKKSLLRRNSDRSVGFGEGRSRSREF